MSNLNVDQKKYRINFKSQCQLFHFKLLADLCMGRALYIAIREHSV